MSSFLLRTDAELDIAREIARARRIHGTQDDLPIMPEYPARQRAYSMTGRTSEAWKTIVNNLAKGHGGKLSWAFILMEEVAEFLDAESAEEQRDELVQVAAMVISMIELIDAAE